MTSQQLADELLAEFQANRFAVAMAVRDLMSAVQTLSQLPFDQLEAEHDDIELTYAQLGRLVHTMRSLRQRSHGYPETVLHPVAMRQVSEVARA